MTCGRCGEPAPSNVNFCGNCGNVLSGNLNSQYEDSVRKISRFFFVLLGYIAVIHFVDTGLGYIQVLVIDAVFALIITVFFLRDSGQLKHLFRLKGLDIKRLSSIGVAFIFLAVAVSLFADFLNGEVFHSKQSTYYEHFVNSPFPLAFCILSIGLFPAVFEEMAMRGIILNDLKGIMNSKSAILISSILFTVLHFSLISWLWIFPIGLVFGYLRVRYRTIWYGVFGHFIYNSSIVLFEMLS